MKQFFAAILLFATPFFGQVYAQNEHPGYLHALSDLRAARWMINHRPGNWRTTADEDAAVRKIEDAIREIKKASIDDGKDIQDHAMADEINDHAGRLQKAIEWLRRARADISQYEDNVFASGLRRRAFSNIDEAIHLTDRARRSIH